MPNDTEPISDHLSFPRVSFLFLTVAHVRIHIIMDTTKYVFPFQTTCHSLDYHFFFNGCARDNTHDYGYNSNKEFCFLSLRRSGTADQSEEM